MVIVCSAIKNRAFFTEKPYKMGWSGITKLKDGSFSARYGQGARHEHLPNGHIIRKLPTVPKDIKKKNHANLKIVPETLEIVEGTPDNQGRKYVLNKKKLRNRILVYTDIMRRCKRWKCKELYFWTITFPKGTADDLCYQLLNTWLTKLRTGSKFNLPMLHSYLWVAERQKNGTIHFHLLIPHRMNVKKANYHMMISICSLIRKGKLNWNIDAAKRYNGVDIHKDRKFRKATNFLEKKKSKLLSYYLSKYISKNNTAMDRLCWNSSVDWSVPFNAVHLTRDELVEIVYNPGLLLIERRFENDYVEFWPWRYYPPARFIDHMVQVNGFLLEDYFLQTGKMKIFLH